MPSAGRARRPISTARYRSALFTAQKNVPVREYYGLTTVVGGPTIVERTAAITVTYSLNPNRSVIKSGSNVNAFNFVFLPVKNSAPVEAFSAITIAFNDALVARSIKTRSSSIPVAFSYIPRLAGIRTRLAPITHTYNATLAGAKTNNSIFTVGTTFALNPTRAITAGKTLSTTVAFNLNAALRAIKQRSTGIPNSYSTLFGSEYKSSAEFVSALTFTVSAVPDVVAVVTDPDDDIKLAALHDVRNRYFRSNVIENSTPLAAFESRSVEFPYSSVYLQFFVGFVSSDVPGVLKLERKLTEDGDWFTVRTWLVTNSVQFVEQIMTGYTRMVLVNSDVPQTRVVFKAEVYGKKDDILRT
jgi:hypothetical protein